MKKHWWYYLLCVILPLIMLGVGLVFLGRADIQRKRLGKQLCIISTTVLIIGSFAYYVFFTPIFGLD